MLGFNIGLVRLNIGKRPKAAMAKQEEKAKDGERSSQMTFSRSVDNAKHGLVSAQHEKNHNMHQIIDNPARHGCCLAPQCVGIHYDVVHSACGCPGETGRGAVVHFCQLKLWIPKRKTSRNADKP